MAKQNKDEKPDVQSENVNEEDVFGSELDKDINAERNPRRITRLMIIRQKDLTVRMT